MLWTEKYRPKSVETFESSNHVKKYLENPTNQHLLLYGPPGTGKTTFAHLIAKNSKILELNASDERGISIVRNKIKSFAMTINHQKTIILDECESLTADAQQCLRRIIEDYSHTTKFIFTTNYLSKIILPLKSRLFAIKFECKPTNFTYLKHVGESEGLDLDNNIYENLFKDCCFDLRRSLNILQGIAPFVDKSLNISEFVGILSDEVVCGFFDLNMQNVDFFIQSFLRAGYSFLQLLKQLNDKLTTQKYCLELSLQLSLCEFRTLQGCSTEIILSDLCYKFIEIKG